jgi:N-methylhydantoinase B/oxoprolinase/acetone carboxylase alpha subunit
MSRHGKIPAMLRSPRQADQLLALRIFQNRLVSVAEEMGEVLMRTAFSPNIKERRDFSCAVFDAAGRLSWRSMTRMPAAHICPT